MVPAIVRTKLQTMSINNIKANGNISSCISSSFVPLFNRIFLPIWSLSFLLTAIPLTNWYKLHVYRLDIMYKLYMSIVYKIIPYQI